MRDNSKTFSIILQKGANPPKHYWLYPKTIKNILLSFSFIFIVVSSVAIGLSLFYLGDYFTFLSTKKTLDNKILSLELEIKDERANWESERRKLENIALEKTSKGLSGLQLIKTLPKAKDITKDLMVEVDNMKVSLNPNDLEFHFHLSNQSTKNRISGRLFTIFNYQNKVLIYPSPKDLESIKFNEGEFFSIARFRRSLIPFKNENIIADKLDSSTLKVIIFSLEGDLIFEKSYKVKEILE